MAAIALLAAFLGAIVTSTSAVVRLDFLSFATEDQKEGMAAFTEKRKPEFKNR